MTEATQTESIVLYAGLEKHIKDHAMRENIKGGYEAVGFIAGKRGEARISSALPLHNRSSDPQAAYFVEPWEQFRAERTFDNAGFEVRGTYHSHPTTEASPSKADQNLARPGELVLIYSVTFEELTGWREKEGSLEPVELVFVDPDE